jgi:hypothetical protein
LGFFQRFSKKTVFSKTLPKTQTKPNFQTQTSKPKLPNYKE